VCYLLDTRTSNVGWTLRPIAPKIATSPPSHFPCQQLAQTRRTLCVPASANNFLATYRNPKDPRPSPLLPALQLASSLPPPSPAYYRHHSHSVNPDFLNYPNPIVHFSLAPFFSLSFLLASHIITSTLFFHPCSLSRQLFIRLAIQSFPLFPPSGGRRKGSLGARRFLRLL
jgi:hypothetical protein